MTIARLMTHKEYAAATVTLKLAITGSTDHYSGYKHRGMGLKPALRASADRDGRTLSQVIKER